MIKIRYTKGEHVEVVDEEGVNLLAKLARHGVYIESINLSCTYGGIEARAKVLFDHVEIELPDEMMSWQKMEMK